MNTQYARQVGAGDARSVIYILHHWVRSDGTPLYCEIRTIADHIDASILGIDDRIYFVAMAGERVVGIIGYRPLPDYLCNYAETDSAVEVVNFFVHKDHLRCGHGSVLLNKVRDFVYKRGFREILVCSGPRYKDSHGFYDAQGQQIATIPNHFGHGHDARIWRLRLDP